MRDPEEQNVPEFPELSREIADYTQVCSPGEYTAAPQAEAQTGPATVLTGMAHS